jgi:hypothetical protein
MDLIDEQFAQLVARYPEASRRANADGTTTILIPQFPLPEGWNKRETEIAFVLPVGFPYAKPDCFWADAELGLISGSQPANSNVQQLPGVARPMRWFSYHASTWNPNRDSALTYTNVIRTRLADRR